MNDMTTDTYIASYDAQYDPPTEYTYVHQSMHQQRCILAADLRELRRIPHVGRIAAKAHLRHAREWDKVCPKPTVAWFRRNAIAALREATAKLPWEVDRNWVNPMSTETYSACGYEDSLAYRRDDAREYAPVAVAMYREAVEYKQAWNQGWRPGDIFRRTEPHITF
jgi:hypothetical protein